MKTSGIVEEVFEMPRAISKILKTLKATLKAMLVILSVAAVIAAVSGVIAFSVWIGWSAILPFEQGIPSVWLLWRIAFVALGSLMFFLSISLLVLGYWSMKCFPSEPGY